MGQPAGPELAIGAIVGDRYEILAELGQGATARVYKARQISTGQLVAIKLLRIAPGGTDPSAELDSRRFRRELQLGAELSHPNIVRLFDSGRLEDGALFAVFEYVPGTTLAEVLVAEGALGFRETLHLMTQVLDALGCAHRRGIVHRDLKPANIIISDTGVRRNALVLDFGLGGFYDRARIQETQVLTKTGEFMGTPLYAAPEQLRGERATARSDLYAWALILLECLLGRHVLEGDARAGVMRVASGESLVIPDWLRQHRLGRLLETYTAAAAEDRDVTLEGALRALEIAGSGPLGAEAGLETAEAMPAGERRPMTIASCRIGLATSGRGELDLEERDALLRRLHAVCAEIAAEGGGQIASKLGDRLLIQFGYPRAREDDARRAARTARNIAAEVGRRADELLPQGLRLDVRIGLHSGLVLTRPIPGSERGVIDAIGATLETAIDLDGHAGPAEILLSAEARASLRGQMVVEFAGDRRLGGMSGAVPTYRLVSGPSPGAAQELHPEPPLVGRARELDLLEAAWEHARAGVPGCLLLAGDVGMGKSRLVRELRRAAVGGVWLECRCLPETRDSPLRPILELLAANGAPGEPLLTRHGLDPHQNVPLFRALFGLPPDPRFPPLALSRERQIDLTLSAIASLLCRMARRDPVVFVAEDLHWADPTTLELLQRLARELQAAQLLEADGAPRLLAVFTARTGFDLAWPELTRFQLGRLGRGEVQRLIESRLGGDERLPDALIEQVIRQADGAPLFVEEVTQMLVARRASAREAGAEAEAPVVPTSLTSLLAARLDALSPDAKETAQLASTLGREFDQALLVHVSPKDGGTLRRDLDELIETGLVFPRGGGPENRYVFKHSLIRDAAYQSMLKAARRGWHARAVSALEIHFSDLSEQQPELLAWHCEGAEDFDAAVGYRRRAGDRAFGHGAYVEAVRHAEKGLDLLRRVSPSQKRTRAELALTESLGTASFSTRGYVSPEVQRAFARAAALCEELGGEVSIRVLWGLWAVQFTAGQDRGTAELIPHFRRRAETRGDPVSLLAAHTVVGSLAYYDGDFEQALAEARKAIDLYPTEEFQAFVREYGYDIGMHSFAYLMCSLCALGYLRQARAVCGRMLATAERSVNPYSLAIARGNAMNLLRDMGDLDAGLDLAERQIQECTEQRLHHWLGAAILARGWVIARRGDSEGGIAEIQRGLQRCDETGYVASRSYLLAGLAEAQLLARQVEPGLETIGRALELSETSLDRFHLCELLRLEGELLLLRKDTEGAELRFRRAIELARERNARSYELNAARSYAHLLEARGEGEAARAMLRPVLDWFRAGFEVPGLGDANALQEDPA